MWGGEISPFLLLHGLRVFRQGADDVHLVLRLGFVGILLVHKTEIYWMLSSEMCLLQSVVCVKLSCVLRKCLMVSKAGGR